MSPIIYGMVPLIPALTPWYPWRKPKYKMAIVIQSMVVGPVNEMQFLPKSSMLIAQIMAKRRQQRVAAQHVKFCQKFIAAATLTALHLDQINCPPAASTPLAPTPPLPMAIIIYTMQQQPQMTLPQRVKVVTINPQVA